MIISDYFQLLFPWLFVTWLLAAVLCRAAPGCLGKTWLKILVPALAAVIALVPLGGLSLADYLLSLNPNFSMGSLALVVVLLWPNLFEQATVVAPPTLPVLPLERHHLPGPVFCLSRHPAR